MALSAEYYNTRVAVWEPLLERWAPVLSMNSGVSRGTVVEVQQQQQQQQQHY